MPVLAAPSRSRFGLPVLNHVIVLAGCSLLGRVVAADRTPHGGVGVDECSGAVSVQPNTVTGTGCDCVALYCDAFGNRVALHVDVDAIVPGTGYCVVVECRR